MPTAMPRPRPADVGVLPADELRGPAHGLLPVAIGRRVPGDEGLAPAGQVAQPDVQPVDAQAQGGLVEVGLDGPVDLRVAEAAEGRGGHGVGEHPTSDDAGGRHAVRPGTHVAALADDAVGDVHVGADEVVSGDILEGDRAVGPQARPHADLRGRPTHGLEGLLQGQHEAHRPAGTQGHEGHQRLDLGVLLAPEATARVRRQDAHPGERHAQDPGQDPLQPVGVLDRRPDGDAVAIGGGHDGVRLDGEVGDDGERVAVLDHEVGRRRFDVTPADPVHLEDIAPRQRVARAKRGLLHERRPFGQGGRQRHDRRQLLVADPHEASGLLRGIPRLGCHGRHRFTVVPDLAHGQHRAVVDLGAEARHRLREVRGRHDQPDTGHGQGIRGVDGHDPGPRHGQRHELRVQLVGQVDVGHVTLAAADPGIAADPVDGLADLDRAHEPVSRAAARTAAMICS